MERRDQEIIDLVTRVRMSNNQLWMKLVEIALEHAPDQTRAVLRSIRQNDEQISDLMRDLAGW